MKKIAVLVLVIGLIPSLVIAGQFRVVKVYDGNTVGVGGYGIEMKVKLAGIDAPVISKNIREVGQPYSRQAKRCLSDLILNRIIDVDQYGNHKNNQMLAVVFLGTKNINLEMVKSGLAEVARSKPPKGFDPAPYIQAETEARKAGKGMWSLGDQYVSPSRWRIIHKRR